MALVSIYTGGGMDFYKFLSRRRKRLLPVRLWQDSMLWESVCFIVPSELRIVGRGP